MARAPHRVADFNTLQDLIAHAGAELGATHVAGDGAHTRIYFPRGGQYPYEEATVWRKNGYWHAQGPGARTGVTALPRDARPIGSGAPRRAAETSQSAVSDPFYIVRGLYDDGYVAGDSFGFDDESTAIKEASKMADSHWFEGDYVEVITRDGELVWDSREGVVEERRSLREARRTGPKPYRPGRGRVGFTIDKVLSGITLGGKDVYFSDGFAVNVHRGEQTGRWYAMRPIDKTYEGRRLSPPEIQAHQYAALTAALGERAGAARYFIDRSGDIFAEEPEGTEMREAPKSNPDAGPPYTIEDINTLTGARSHRKATQYETLDAAIESAQRKARTSRKFAHFNVLDRRGAVVAAFGGMAESSRGRVEDYVAVDTRDRVIGGPFKHYSDAKTAAGSAGIVKFVPSRPIMSERHDQRLFIGVYPTGIAYADKRRERHGDYAHCGFLSFGTLELELERDCPAQLRGEIERHAADIQARRGQEYPIDSSGHTVILGRRAMSESGARSPQQVMAANAEGDGDYVVQGLYDDGSSTGIELWYDDEREALNKAKRIADASWFEGDYVRVISRDGEPVWEGRGHLNESRRRAPRTKARVRRRK